MNLEHEEDLDLFSHDLTISELFQAILLTKNVVSTMEIFFYLIDEIQNSTKAIAILRYFYEQLVRSALTL